MGAGLETQSELTTRTGRGPDREGLMASSQQMDVARPLPPASLGDTTLVHLARNGDLGAFIELCHRHSWTAWETAFAVAGDAGE